MTQVWNKQGKFRVGSYWAYRDEKAFIDCQKLLNGIPQDEDNPSIANADRGVVRLHWQAELWSVSYSKPFKILKTVETQYFIL